MKEKKTILVVDDEQDLLETIEYKIKKWGYNTILANNAEKALNILEKQPVHLILSDIRMPGKFNGIALLEEIKQRFLIKPVFIFLTGSGDISEHEARLKGACGVVIKPFKPDELQIVIEENLKKYPRFKRRFERLKISLSANLYNKQYRIELPTHTFSIGQGGFFACSQALLLDPGSIVNFQIHFNHDQFNVLSGIGEIVWLQKRPSIKVPTGMGIMFHNIPEKWKNFLKDYINQNNLQEAI